MSDVDQTRRVREFEEKEKMRKKTTFMFKPTCFRDVSHKTTKKSSRAIVHDLSGWHLVQLY